MSLFKPAENTMACFKAGFMGEAGSGKTHTATIAAIGLVLLLKDRKLPGADRPVFMLDTENGSSWVKPMFDEAGIELQVAKTRAFKDLVPAVREAEKNASVLFVDSITHFWLELQASYLRRMSEKRGREITALEFQDWAYIKGQWGMFSDAFVTSNLHCILSGRLGWEYEHTEDERGRKQMEKSGAKMQAEKGLGYEPNILVWMERSMDLHSKVVTRTATVLKDRSRKLDGKQFANPTFKSFLPHIEFMALGGKHEAVDTGRTSDDTITAGDGSGAPGDSKAIRREIVLEEIQALMVKHYPTRSADDQKGKGELLRKYFDTVSWTEVEKVLSLVDLQAYYNNMHSDLEGKPSRYGVQLEPVPPVQDEIPHLIPAKEAATPPADQPAKQLATQEKPVVAVPAENPAETGQRTDAEPDDLDTVIRDFEAALANAKDANARRNLWVDTAEYREVMSEDQLTRIKKIYQQVLMAPQGKAPRSARRAA